MNHKHFLVMLLIFILTGLSGTKGEVERAHFKDNSIHKPTTTHFLSNPDSFISIDFVGRSSQANSEVTIQQDGSYLFIDSQAQSTRNEIVIKANLSGFSCWGSDCENTSISNRTGQNAKFVAGQVYLIVNGIIETMEGADFRSSGFRTFLNLGLNVIILLSVNKGQNNNFNWVQESIVIQCVKAEDSIQKIDYLSLPFSHSITDEHIITDKLTGSFVEFEDNFVGPDWTKIQVFKPEIKNLRIGNSESSQLAKEDPIELDWAEDDVMNLITTINSSGFDGFIIDQVQNVTKGHVFVYDAKGAKLVNDPAISVDIFESEVTPFGIVVISEYGLWLEEFNDGEIPIIDFEGFASLLNATVIDLGCLKIN